MHPTTQAPVQRLVVSSQLIFRSCQLRRHSPVPHPVAVQTGLSCRSRRRWWRLPGQPAAQLAVRQLLRRPVGAATSRIPRGSLDTGGKFEALTMFGSANTCFGAMKKLFTVRKYNTTIANQNQSPFFKALAPFIRSGLCLVSCTSLQALSHEHSSVL